MGKPFPIRPWSKLQRQLYNIIAPGLDFQIQCRVYRMKSQCGQTDLPRYWITLGKETIWDYPKQFLAGSPHYPHITDISEISNLIRAYIDAPAAKRLAIHFPEDQWGLVDILRAADRRVGTRQWAKLRDAMANPAAIKVLEARKKLPHRALQPAQCEG